MQFQVPQFIEVEDKIFGPLTFKQFIYLAGGVGLSVVFWVLLPIYISLLLIVPVFGFALALAFYKVNNKPFINVVEAAFKYMLNSKLYLWRKETSEASVTKTKEKIIPESKTQTQAEANPSLFIPKLSNSKLKELTWSLDIRQAGNITDKGIEEPIQVSAKRKINIPPPKKL